jgi:hypothetical protein
MARLRAFLAELLWYAFFFLSSSFFFFFKFYFVILNQKNRYFTLNSYACGQKNDQVWVCKKIQTLCFQFNFHPVTLPEVRSHMHVCKL